MKSQFCKICTQANRQRLATGTAAGKYVSTPVCDECGKAHEAKGGAVKWNTPQMKLITA